MPLSPPFTRLARVALATRLLIALAGLSVATGAAAEPLTFDGAVALAAQTSPTVAAVAAQREAARQAAVAAGERPDPKLAFGVENFPIGGPDRFSLTRDFMTMQRLAVMQELPSAAKRDARLALAQARVARTEAEHDEALVTARREAALVWTQRHTVEQQLRQLDALAEENRLLETMVRAQLAGGRGMPSDAVTPRQEAAMLAERRDELDTRRAQAIAALRRWIGDAAAEPLAGEPPREAMDATRLRHRLHAHPELATVERMASELDAEVQEAQAMKQADWGVELAYQRRGRAFGDMVSVQFTRDLPWFSEKRQDPLIAAKRAEREAVVARRESVRREHLQMLETDLAERDRLDRALQRNRQTLQPLADERVALAMASYRAGKGGLAEVLSARKERVELQLKALAIQGELDLAVLRLRMAADSPRGHDVPGDAK